MPRRRAPASNGLLMLWEAQQVIALRLAKLALGGPAARKEAHTMVAEKMTAAVRASQMIGAAAMRGRAQEGTDAALRMVHRRVRANRKRLTKI